MESLLSGDSPVSTTHVSEKERNSPGFFVFFKYYVYLQKDEPEVPLEELRRAEQGILDAVQRLQNAGDEEMFEKKPVVHRAESVKSNEDYFEPTGQNSDV